MARPDPFKDLDPKLANALSEATAALRSEFDRKLAETRAELGLESDTAVAAGEAVEMASDDRPEGVGAEILDPIEELKHAVAAVDRSSSQGEVLGELVSGCSRFASRCVIFLLRDQQIGGWSSHGFPIDQDDLRDLRFDIDADSPWQQMAESEGAVALSRDACGSICEKLGGTAPEMGLLIPFVLRNRTAAAVYCDRVAGDGPPNIAALQLLVFVASQVLENLPVRNRESTSTLRIAAGVDAAEPMILEEAPAPEPEIPAPIEPVVPVPEEIDETEEAAAEPEEVVDFEVEEETLEEVAEEPLEEAAEVGTVVTAAIETTDALFEAEPETEEATAVTAPEPVTEAAEEPADEPQATVEPAAEKPAATATQVAPPEDLEGPGWAFSGGRGQPADTADEAQHEEARRLARLLVTEVKLYNEELVQQGRQKGSVYSVLKDDIDRSRQIFEDRIDEDVRRENDYFEEALVRILAGGDAALLGAPSSGP